MQEPIQLNIRGFWLFIFSLLFSLFFCCSARRLVPFWPLPICHLSHFRYPNVIFYCKIDLWLLVGLRLCVLSRAIPTSPLSLLYAHTRFRCLFMYSFYFKHFFFLLFGFIISFFFAFTSDYSHFDVWNKLKEDDQRKSLHWVHVYVYSLSTFSTHTRTLHNKIVCAERKYEQQNFVSSRIIFLFVAILRFGVCRHILLSFAPFYYYFMAIKWNVCLKRYIRFKR